MQLKSCWTSGGNYIEVDGVSLDLVSKAEKIKILSQLFRCEMQDATDEMLVYKIYHHILVNSNTVIDVDNVHTLNVPRIKEK